MPSLTHLNQTGEAAMVDISSKHITLREATAIAKITMQPETLQLLQQNQIKKGDVLSVARIAGIQAAKKTADLIPLCHSLALNKIDIEFELDVVQSCVDIRCYCKLSGKTGVEMEALTGASIAALTIFDMCKGVDRSMVISGLCVAKKSGGQSGDYQRQSLETIS